MKVSRNFTIGFMLGVLCTTFAYYAVFHESTPNKSTAGEDSPPVVRVAKIEQAISLTPYDLHELSGLQITSLEQRVNLPSGSIQDAIPNHRMVDDWMHDEHWSFDNIVAIPIIESSNYLVIGMHYGHAHAVSIFSPRWHTGQD